METINNKLPATVGINNVVKGVYEFDVVILQTGVPGFDSIYYMTHQAMSKGKQKLYLRIGNTYMPESYRCGNHIPEFVLGDFTKVWMEGDFVKGTVVIYPHHYKLFDDLVDALGGVMPLGVCSLTIHYGQYRNSARVITDLLGAQLLDPTGHSLMNTRNGDVHEIHDIGLKAMPGTADYIKFCAEAIATEPFVPKVEEEVPPPSADLQVKPYAPHENLTIAPIKVKGLNEGLADVAAKAPQLPEGVELETFASTKDVDVMGGDRLDKEIKEESDNGA